MTQSTTSDQLCFDIIVVGAGMVGSAVACALAQGDSSLKIAVVEAVGESQVFSGREFDPRVVALTRASETLLDSVGAWQKIEAERVCPYTDMDVWDASGTGHIHFNCSEVQQLNLGYIVEHSLICRSLMACLVECNNIELLQPARVSALKNSGLQSELSLEDGRMLSAPLVIAADGANSRVRQLAGIDTREWDYGHHAIVTTVCTEESHKYTAWQRFLDSGPLAFLPLRVGAEEGGGDSHYSSIVWSITPELAAEVMALEDDVFKARLSEAFEYRLGSVIHVARRFSFPLRQRHAVNYIHDGIALVGDSAHTIHPLAGQGVNLGFQDVAALTAEVLRARRRQLPLTEPSILKRYQRNRKGDNLAMMGMMEGFKRLFGANELPVRWVRNEGMRRLNSLPMLKNAVVKQAMGL